MNIQGKLEIALSNRDSLVKQFQERTNAYRWVHSGADGFDGITVDMLGEVILVEQHRETADVTDLIKILLAKYPEAPIFFKKRWSTQSEQRAGLEVTDFKANPNRVVVENGLQFGIRLLDEEHIGLFLDSRQSRQWVKANSNNKRVLNLFSYTGGFGVYAAAGGATSTVNIDNKNSALQIAQRNYERNALAFDHRTFFKCDALYYLQRAAKQNGRFDLIIVDPPPRFKRRRQRDFLAHRDYGDLIRRCIGVLDSKGQILAGLNSLRANDESMDAMILEVAALTEATIQIGDTLSADIDFPPTVDRPTARFRQLHVEKK